MSTKKTLLVVSLVALTLTGCAGGPGATVGKNDQPVTAKSTVDTKPTVKLTTTSKNVLFTSQAPYKVWDEVHKETCEEASVLMAWSWYDRWLYMSAARAEENILAIVEWEKKTFGYFEDTTMSETAKILTDFYEVPKNKVIVLTDGKLEEIVKQLDEGAVVILPAAGQKLGNPYFRQPGPIYHNLLLLSYDRSKKEFITNDPGTKRGRDYRYAYSVIDNAWHDWQPKDILKGARNAIAVYR